MKRELELSPEKCPYYAEGNTSVCDYFHNIVNLGQFLITYLGAQDVFQLGSNLTPNLDFLIQKKELSFWVQRESHDKAIEINLGGKTHIYMMGENLNVQKVARFIKDGLSEPLSKEFVGSYWQLIHVIKKLDYPLFIEIHRSVNEVFVNGYAYSSIEALMKDTFSYWDKNWKLLVDNYCEQKNKALLLDLTGSRTAISCLHQYFLNQDIANNGNAFFTAFKLTLNKQLSKEPEPTCVTNIGLTGSSNY